MRTKLIPGTILALALSSLHFASGQEAEFSFKLYMESLANGKKDTLELGISPDGHIGCDYQNVDADVVFDPFLDQQTHIGAFVTPDRQWNEERFQYIPNCMVFFKKGINADQGSWVGGAIYDIFLLVPYNSLPVILRWDRNQIQSPVGITDRNMSEEWTVKSPAPKRYTGFYLAMNEYDSLILNPVPDTTEGWLYFKMPDSIYYQTFITDSNGIDHGFRNLYLDIIAKTSNEERPTSTQVRLFPNPASESFFWHSSLPLQEWNVFDASGSLILKGDTEQNEINCQSWPSGLYIFEWISNTGQSGKNKFIKQ